MVAVLIEKVAAVVVAREIQTPLVVPAVKQEAREAIRVVVRVGSKRRQDLA